MITRIEIEGDRMTDAEDQTKKKLIINRNKNND